MSEYKSSGRQCGKTKERLFNALMKIKQMWRLCLACGTKFPHDKLYGRVCPNCSCKRTNILKEKSE